VEAADLVRPDLDAHFIIMNMEIGVMTFPLGESGNAIYKDHRFGKVLVGELALQTSDSILRPDVPTGYLR